MENQNQSVEPENDKSDGTKPGGSGNKPLIITLVVIIVILVLAVGALAGYFVYYSQKNNPFNQNFPVANNTNDGLPINSDQNPPATTTDQAQATTTGIGITWNTPQSIASLGLFNFMTEEGMVASFNPEKEAKYFKVGTITSGKYQGGEIILVNPPADGPSFYPWFDRFIKQGNNFIYLKKYSNSGYSQVLESKYTVDNTNVIPQLDFPQTITGPSPREVLTLDPYAGAFFSLNNVKKSFTDPVLGDVYTSATLDPTNSDLFKRAGFYIKAPDGTVRVYSLKIDFMAANTSNMPEITWSDGKQNKTDYNYTDHTGCGSSNYVSVSTVGDDELKVTGKNSKGDDIYEFKNTNDPRLKDLYDNKYQIYDGTKKISYSAFVASHPMFFWRDPFGRLIKFENATYIPMAECGKPVIYLYPTVAGKFSVQVEPQGGMTYSDPEYNGGWNVWSDTNSNLTDLSSGAKYPYLFWEGRGGIYQQPEKGFVIKKSEVHKFLIEKLALLGLNGKETADFMEFWEPRMQSAPYYFVTFLGTSQMDQLAPLVVSPKPDTVIRILMDFSPLQKPIKVQGYNIKTPVRKGFTVVEWGGVIR